MIKFFRRIRQNLVLENKTGKPALLIGRYFNYAIGEILLVVIGILIALQINNWNEDRKTVKAAKVHLNNLVDAIQDDSIQYINALEGSLFRYYSSQYLLRMADEVPYDMKADGHRVELWKGNHIWEEQIPTVYHKEYIKLAFLWTHRFGVITETPSTIEELKKTDAYSYLNNELLKDAIDEYYAEFEWRLGPLHEEINRKDIFAWQNTLMDEGIINSAPYVKGDPIDLLKSNPMLIGRLRGMARQSSWATMCYKIMIDRGSELSSLIEEEILKM